MPTVHTFFPICRTTGNLTFYLWDGKNFVRKKSRLTAKRVKTSPRFEHTRYYAGLMARASRIGSSLFQSLPVRWRQSWMYRTFTGEALKLLKEGKTQEEATEILWALYVKEVVEAESNRQLTINTCSVPTAIGTTDAPKRSYTKRNSIYWARKTKKAQRRKSRKEKLQHYAGLLARASVIGSAVYKSLPAARQKHALYKALTGSAMELLKEEWADEDVRAFLMKMMLKKPGHRKQLQGCYTLEKAYSSANASNDTLMQAPQKVIKIYGLHTGIRKRREQDLLIRGNNLYNKWLEKIGIKGFG